MADFPAYLRGHLERREWTQADLARAGDVDRTLVGRWMKGTVGPGVENCRAVAHALGRPLVEVLVAAGLITEEEARERLDAKAAPARRGGPVDLAALTDDQLLREIARRLGVVDAGRTLTRGEAEGDGMITGRPKRSRSGAKAVEA
ncbi:helix-turn-helix transcriptional regulator [Amycolatopsis magusensis]|uniref:helix-turn-helix transcriptional regulator n=1 Tax=Amycolatopsis magusensis TaxID=882444 RepID=UPI0037BC2D46